MSVSIRTRRTGVDPVARAHRRAASIRAMVWTLVVLLLVGGGVWLMFASSVFAVTEVDVSGGTPAIRERVHQSVEDVLGQKRLGYLRPARNILLLNTVAVAASLRTALPSVADIDVEKVYPHTVRIFVSERVPIGSWCIEGSCQFFDVTGVRWGSVVPSRGPLLLLVHDERSSPQTDDRLFAGMLAAVNGLPEIGMRAIEVTFPDSAPGDMRITVAAGYDILVDALGDVDDALGTLGVLIADRAADPGFHPQYIDVRTPGRAYYK